MGMVVISGAIANKHRQGGEAWVRLSWALGFKKLGFQIYFIEQIGRETCVDGKGQVVPFRDSENLEYFKTVVEQFGLNGSSALIYENGEEIYGATYADLIEIAADADLLVNISGHLSLEALIKAFPLKAYIDIDPGFTQFWHADPSTTFRLGGYDFYFTIGENIGASDCSIPTNGIEWRPTRQPIVLTDWTAAQNGASRRFTTIANWRGPFGVIQFGDKTFGLKVHEFRKVLELPRRSAQTFEIALNIHAEDQKDLEMLRASGWQITDPKKASGDPGTFRSYIQSTGAEFSVAQGIYVDTNSGWFSDRTVRYLASGKPALVQDTGFSKNLPVGEGLIAFRTLDEAVAGAESIARDYERHSRAARALAEEYFDSDRVLGKLISEVGIAP